MTWQLIETLPRDEEGCAPFPVVVAWLYENPFGNFWEYDIDETVDCATHWMRLPEPPK